MGLFDKLFNNKEPKKETAKKKKDEPIKKYDLESEITCILDILSHLGLLDTERIEKQLKDNKDFDKSILSRLMIQVDEKNISSLKKYFQFQQLAYGRERISIYRSRLMEYSSEKIKQGKNREEVIEEMISIVRTEIDHYEMILKSLNEEVIELENSSKNQEEIQAMIDFLMNQYEEQELGFPVNLKNRIRVMANELSQLPYGGYGEDEIELFVDAANKMVEEGRLSHEESTHTLSRIKAELFNPKKNRYNSDLETLNKKLTMIQDSSYISDFEKEQNRLKTIAEFNQMNGHKMGVKETIARLKRSLEDLEYGGFGDIITSQFLTKADQICEEFEAEGEEKIIKQIQFEYHKLAKEYEVHLKKLKDKIKEIQEDDKIVDKQGKVDELLVFFRDEMGHTIQYKDRIQKMCDELSSLECGGYSDDIVESFRTDSLEKAMNASSHDELANCMKQISRKYNEYMSRYQDSLVELKEKIKSLEQSDKTEEEIQLEKQDLERGFQAKFGHKISFEELIEENAKSLGSLEHGGYGKTVLDDYRFECHKVLDLETDPERVYESIQRNYYDLKNKYLKNLGVFKEWKEIQLNNKKGQEKIELEKDLDTKITYMLSLSSKELYDYYMEDDRKKKAEAYRHNYMAAYRYLAREESRKKRNKSLYDRRLQELTEGKQLYSNNEIDMATKKLESNYDSEVLDEDRIISLIEYIDSTLFRQIFYAEASLEEKKNNKKV